MIETSGTEPVRWWCFDGWCDPPTEPVPGPDWEHWEARYDNDCERGKRTTRDLDRVYKRVEPAPRIEDSRAEWSRRLGYPVTNDPTRHGGGLHVTAPGGWLNCHLDYDRHPILSDRRRALNLIVFLNREWRPEWGGQFYLADPLGNPVVQLDPVPGRLIAFEVSDLSYHGVLPTTPDAPERVSAAAYLLCAADLVRACDARATRRRAVFLPNRVEPKPAGTAAGRPLLNEAT